MIHEIRKLVSCRPEGGRKHSYRIPINFKKRACYRITEVANVLGSVADFTVCNVAARFADASYPGSVAVWELSELIDDDVNDLGGKILESCHEVLIEEDEHTVKPRYMESACKVYRLIKSHFLGFATVIC